MSRSPVVGLKPWLPRWLARSRWWTRPVPAERLAALRVGVGLVLLLDVLGTYLPRHADFFGAGSLSAPGAGSAGTSLLDWHRHLLAPIASADVWLGLLLLWAGAAVCLTVGLWPRLAAGVAWFLSLSVISTNPALHNAGDQVRTILLLLLALSPCGATWAVSARHPPPVRVRPWPLRLLFVQLAAIYFMNGVFKLGGAHWHDGQALTILLGDPGWTRWSFADWPLAEGLLCGLTWAVLVWEVGFPALMLIRPLRKPALVFGVLFHLGSGLALRLGPFPLYMLCLYLPLLPWERWRRLPGREARVGRLERAAGA
jgi:hypothetical protein